VPKNLAETFTAKCRTVNFQFAYRNVGMARFTVTENPGGLNGSLQHLVKAFLKEPRKLILLAGVNIK
jgi:hypothetical protein